MKVSLLSSGAVLVRKSNENLEFLLLRSFKYWDFPKGLVEKNENPWKAAIREIHEETGLTDFKASVGEKYYETEPYGKGKVARYYLLECVGEQKIVLLPNPFTGVIEHHEYRWVRFDEAMKLLVPRVQKVLKWAHHLLGHESHSSSSVSMNSLP